MAKQASLIAWYGLSCSGSRVIGGLPESTHQQLIPHTTFVFPTCRQIAAVAQGNIGVKARLVLHGEEFGRERYGLAASESVRTVYAGESPLDVASLVVGKGWNEVVLAAARTLKWPAGSMQWWVAAVMHADYD